MLWHCNTDRKDFHTINFVKEAKAYKDFVNLFRVLDCFFVDFRKAYHFTKLNPPTQLYI